LKDEEEGDESEGRYKGLHLEEEEEPKTTLRSSANANAISTLDSSCRNNK
jgi:hypothetical protein